MYEIELRALVDNFDLIKSKLDKFEKKEADKREATIFFINPHKDDFELRLRLEKGRSYLSFKEGHHKSARKEIELDISNPEAMYRLLLASGFTIKMIVARVKYTYCHKDFEILLNCVINWGDAVEVEKIVENEKDSENVEAEIENFIKEELGLKLLAKEKLKEMNKEYCEKIDFEKISVLDLLDYVQEKRDINFISSI